MSVAIKKKSVCLLLFCSFGADQNVLGNRRKKRTRVKRKGAALLHLTVTHIVTQRALRRNQDQRKERSPSNYLNSLPRSNLRVKPRTGTTTLTLTTLLRIEQKRK